MINAIEFVKQNGIEKCKRILDDLTDQGHNGDFYKDLKKIANYFEWVEKFGGLDGFKDEYMSRIENNECVSGMSNAIELVEKCK